jgi:hypothetical protein
MIRGTESRMLRTTILKYVSRRVRSSFTKIEADFLLSFFSGSFGTSFLSSELEGPKRVLAAPGSGVLASFLVSLPS